MSDKKQNHNISAELSIQLNRLAVKSANSFRGVLAAADDLGDNNNRLNPSEAFLVSEFVKRSSRNAFTDELESAVNSVLFAGEEISIEILTKKAERAFLEDLRTCVSADGKSLEKEKVGKIIEGDSSGVSPVEIREAKAPRKQL